MSKPITKDEKKELKKLRRFADMMLNGTFGTSAVFLLNQKEGQDAWGQSIVKKAAELAMEAVEIAE